MARGRAGRQRPRTAKDAARGKPRADKPTQPAMGSVEWALDWAKSLAVAFLIFLVLRTFLVQTFVITSGSMEDALLVGDFLAVSRAAYGPRIPGTDAHLPGYEDFDHAEIIVFRPPHDPDIDVVKRIVALPGDTVAMRAGLLYRNGEAVVEPYVKHLDHEENDVRDAWMDWQLPFLIPGSRPEGFRPSRDEWGPVVVPEGRLLTLGDNRDDSIDSRYWGFL
ncbi:MAG TPA: signal peptidase I, partial [Longimicrobiales bacterium]|nr:signal peptidase I [Longimicrobiales bacterium]